MTSRWRYIEEDAPTASFGLAADEYMARGLSASPYSHILRLYVYKKPCALVGRYQELDSELHLPFCKAIGIEINRRPTGGGAIIMGEEQLGIAIAIPEFSPLSARTIFEVYSQGIIAALKHLGITAEFRPKNDILVKDRKIAGLALLSSFGATEGLASCALLDARGQGGLFHASLISDLDIELMPRVLKKPLKVPGGITTVSKELGRKVSIRELSGLVKKGFQEALGAEIIPEPFTPEELVEIKSLEEEKYQSRDWVHGQRCPYAEPRVC